MSELFTEILMEDEPAESNTPPAVPANVPTIYYSGKGGYAIQYKGGFIPLPNEGQVSQHIGKAGVPREAISGILCAIRTENFVSYIGPVAGHKTGLHTAPDSGQSFLVTHGPKLIIGEPGSWSFINDFLHDLLGDGDQYDAAVAWLRQARRNVVAGKRRPLPAAVFVGPRNCGKSLMLEISRLCLGGRSAPAFAALSGGTAFNGDIIGAELLTIDDEIASKDHRARTQLAQGIKKHLFAGSVRVEAKFREAITMRPVQAVAIAVNNEAEHLQVLPAIDDSVADKISLFDCARANLEGLHDRDEIAARIQSELAAFCYHLDTTDHPEHLRDQRTGAAAWQSPVVMEQLLSIAPEERLRELLAQCLPITQAIANPAENEWRGSADAVERLLKQEDITRASAHSLLTWNGACGSYLGKLRSSKRAQITTTLVRGITQWRITGLEPAELTQARPS